MSMPDTSEPNVTQLPAVQTRKPQEIRVVTDPIAVLDTARFEHMQRIARVMASTNLIPETLCMEGKGDQKELLPLETVTANCFLVVNQAVRWNMDPFAVAQCVSVVHGKLCYEGKLIAAVLEAKIGVRLRYEWSGVGEQMRVKVSGKLPDGVTEEIEGSVIDWRTIGNNSPWKPAMYRKMLAYRGAREWCRLYAPGLMLGVYSDDELENITEDARSLRAQDVTPRAPSPPSPPRVEAPRTQPANHDPVTGEIWDDMPAQNNGTTMSLQCRAPSPPRAPSPAQAQRSESLPVPGQPAPRNPDRGAGAAEMDGIPDFLDRRDGDPDFDGADWLVQLDGAFTGCDVGDTEELAALRDKYMTPYLLRAAKEHRKAAQKLFTEHSMRVSGLTTLHAG